MMPAGKRRWFLRVALVLVGCLLGVTVAALAASAADGPFPDLSRSEALALGERMYRQGLLPSGEPMEAIVQGDIPVDGTMFSCESCHLRSGAGSIEGTIITLPTSATELFKPFTKAPEETFPDWEEVPAEVRTWVQRPAYDDASLARVLWTGVDPAGRELNLVMPRYDLSERDMGILVFYLRNLSAAPDPGVDATTLRFATVVTEGVDPVSREAMLAILNAHVRDRNAQSRSQEERASKGVFYQKKMTTAYRRLALDVWELKGPRETWPEQLASYYQRQPVFALIGGMANGSWQPIHDFCEARHLPALLPLTDFPVISDSDWYTLYFSKGWYQEGEAAARYLGRYGGGKPVLQLYRDEPAARALAEGFRQTAKNIGLATTAEALPVDLPVDEKFWQEVQHRHPGKQPVLWLTRPDLATLGPTAWPEEKILVLSYRLAALTPKSVPAAMVDRVLFTYPYRMPELRQRTESVVNRWLEIRQIKPTLDPLDDQVYYIGWLLTGILMDIKNDFYRDYFLDAVDMMNDEVYAIPLYQRLSFGPGQRYASKGCYLVRPGRGGEPPLVPVSDWVIH